MALAATAILVSVIPETQYARIGDLHLALPLTAHGEMQVSISLITPDDKVITDTETVLKVAPAPTVPTAQSPTAQLTGDDGGAQDRKSVV